MKAHTPPFNVLAGRHNGGRAGAREIPLSADCQRIHLRSRLVGRGATGAGAPQESRNGCIGREGPIPGWGPRPLTTALCPRPPPKA